ncbi:MAG: LamG-like jellyroll fold domain-containing protein, partial [Akkermansiaceae bacterium]
MKSLLIPILVVTSLSAQVSPPTSVPAEDTLTPFTSGDSLNNSRLFLSYSAEKIPIVKFGDYSLELPAGENLTADLTYEHLPNHPATIHLKSSGDPTTQRFEIPNSRFSDRAVDFTPLPGKDFPMGKAFTLLVRFSTTAENGTLTSRAPTEGEWKPKGKTLFLRDGRLTYDIGWVGDLGGGPAVNDGKEHLAAVTTDSEGRATLYLDGKKIAGPEKLSSPDHRKHVFKIGTTATDFAGDFSDGTISQVLYWKRALNRKEIRTLTDGKTTKLNTPDFHWKNPNPSPLNQGPKSKSFNVRVQLSNLKVHQSWIQPLEVSDHAALIRAWGKDSLQRGQKIYRKLCITCHGDERNEGSIPIALKFHEGRFKNGADPYRMFQTLTKGYGTMMPMPQYSTRQKYDVIHYIRSQFLAKSNPTQLTEISDGYLHKLPLGQSLVKEQETTESIPPYKMMDFGNVLFGTYQIEPGPIDENVNIAQKGIAIRLDPG